MSSAGIEPTLSAYQAPVLPLNYKPKIEFEFILSSAGIEPTTVGHKPIKLLIAPSHIIKNRRACKPLNNLKIN